MKKEAIRELINYIVPALGSVIVVLYANQYHTSFGYLSWAEGVILGVLIYSHLRLNQKLNRLQRSSDTTTEKNP